MHSLPYFLGFNTFPGTEYTFKVNVIEKINRDVFPYHVGQETRCSQKNNPE